ncbi:MAG: glutathione S-transferase family protein, partial [Methylobacteriaceae bacterium]|nr:glutathione S-transferase family protein [Methylobacteriaceae bacterium]
SRLSGNAWKVRILLNQLKLPFERVTLDFAGGDLAKPEFAAKSRFKRIPVLELDDGRTLVESSAILLYLAEGSPLLPDDRFLRTEVTSWLFFEQFDLTRTLAVPRFFKLRGVYEQEQEKVRFFHEIGYAGLTKLEAWLASHKFLVDERYTIADLGVFPYIYMAGEGGYEMNRFPAIEAWTSRVTSQPGYVPLIEETKA